MLGLLGPEAAHSPNADEMNALYWVLLILAVAIFIVINGALVALVMRFRAKRGVEPRRFHTRPRASFLMGGVLATLATIIFVAGVIVTEDATEVEATGSEGLVSDDGDATPLQIEATGQQWLWRYEYPDGTFSYHDLVVPVDTAVEVNIGSTDVVHRWWVPGLTAKADAVPEQGNGTWFKADEVGEYDGTTYQFAGASGAAMRTTVVVLSVEDYEAWLEQQTDDIQAAQEFVQAQVEEDSQLANPADEDLGGAEQGQDELGGDPDPGPTGGDQAVGGD